MGLCPLRASCKMTATRECVLSVTVHVRLFGTLRQSLGRAEAELTLPDGATVREAVLACGLDDRVDIWALVDGRRTDRQTPLVDGAQVQLFQPEGGG